MFKKKEKVTLEIACEECGCIHKINWRQVSIMPVGYKGKMKCYIRCEQCNKIVIIPRDKVSKLAKRRFGLKKFF